jgi:hypothetical protein
MQIENRLGLPEAIVKAVSTELHNKTDKELSATTLLKGIKEIIIERRHWNELKVDAADSIWAVWGEAVHALLETEGKHEFCEVDVHDFIGEIKITGRIDNYDMEAGVITDYKTASVWKILVGDLEDWRMQGIIYSWLLHNNDCRVKKCRIVAMLKDHSKSKAKFDSSYPQSPVFIYEFQVTKELLEEAEKFVKQRVAEYLKYIDKADDDIPPCTDKERWAEKTKHAVMKKGNKRAVKVCDTIIEAQQKADSLGAGHYVETRPGTSKKCSDYCVCKDYCNFYNNIVKQQETREE